MPRPALKWTGQNGTIMTPPKKKAAQPAQAQKKVRRAVNTTLDADLVLRAQQRCLAEHCYLNDVLEQLLDLWLSNKVKLNCQV